MLQRVMVLFLALMFSYGLSAESLKDLCAKAAAEKISVRTAIHSDFDLGDVQEKISEKLEVWKEITKDYSRICADPKASSCLAEKDGLVKLALAQKMNYYMTLVESIVYDFQKEQHSEKFQEIDSLKEISVSNICRK